MSFCRVKAKTKRGHGKGDIRYISLYITFMSYLGQAFLWGRLSTWSIFCTNIDNASVLFDYFQQCIVKLCQYIYIAHRVLYLYTPGTNTNGLFLGSVLSYQHPDLIKVINIAFTVNVQAIRHAQCS